LCGAGSHGIAKQVLPFTRIQFALRSRLSALVALLGRSGAAGRHCEALIDQHSICAYADPARDPTARNCSCG